MGLLPDEAFSILPEQLSTNDISDTATNELLKGLKGVCSHDAFPFPFNPLSTKQ